MRPDGSVPEVMLAALVVSVVADVAKPETAVDAIAMAVLDADVIWPWALTAMVGTLAARPYEAAVTAVLAMLNVVDGERFKPVPAE